MLSKRYRKPAGFSISGFFLGLLLSGQVFGQAVAAPQQPLASRNLGVLANLYGIPAASPAELLSHEQSRLLSSLNINNTLLVQRSNTEDLTVDIESWSFALQYDLGLSDHWMLRLQLPFVAYTGGILDKHIDSYHQFFDLDEDSRPLFSHNQIQVSYSVNEDQQILLTERQKDLGDISIQLAWQQHRDSQSALSYWVSLKLPTGNPENFSGSGHPDLSFWLASQHQYSTHWLYTQLGFIYMSDSDVLSQQHQQWAGFANLGIAFSPWENFELKTQLDIHSELYRSSLDFLGPSYQLTIGGSFYLNPRHQLDLAISEDIHAGSAPDINFNISWYYYLD